MKFPVHCQYISTIIIPILIAQTLQNITNNKQDVLERSRRSPWLQGYNRASRGNAWANSPSRQYSSSSYSSRNSKPSSSYSSSYSKPSNSYGSRQSKPSNSYSSSYSKPSSSYSMMNSKSSNSYSSSNSMTPSSYSPSSYQSSKSYSKPSKSYSSNSFSSGSSKYSSSFPASKSVGYSQQANSLPAKTRSFSSPPHNLPKSRYSKGTTVKFPSYAVRCGNCNGQAKSPVCGSDGKTYPNRCELENISCRKYWDITVVSQGPCQSQCTGVDLGMYTGFGLSRASNKGYCHHDFFRCVKSVSKVGIPRSEVKSCCQARADKCFEFVESKPWRSGVQKYGK